MAIYHCSVKNISRSSGRSSVAAAAYRSGECLTNDYDGITHDYRNRECVAYSEIILPDNAPERYHDRGTIWNAAEESEKRVNSRTAREIEIALPNELDRNAQIEVLRSYVKNNFVEQGMCADITLHDKGDGNPHSHILLTTREVAAEGFTKKNRDWNKRSQVNQWRENWAKECNQKLQQYGIDERIDHRSLKDQGIDREPTIHLGKTATNLEKKGIQTELGNLNREVEERNRELNQINLEIENIQNDIKPDLEKRIDNMEYDEKVVDFEKVKESRKKQPQQEQPQQLQPNQTDKIQGGAFSSIDRTDEQETKEIQRSGGLAREEYGFSKAEEMEYSQENRNQNSHELPPTVKTAEETVKQLNALKQEYKDVNSQIKGQIQEQHSLDREYENTNKNIEKLEELRDRVKNNDQQIEKLRDQKKQLGLFKGDQKKNIDQQIERLQKSRDQATRSIKEDYGVGVNDSNKKLENMKGQAERIKEQRDKQPTVDIEQLQKQQKEVMQQYKLERIKAEVHPQWQEIKEQTSTQNHNSCSLKEKMEQNKIEVDLNNISQKDYQRAIKELTPEQANLVKANKIKEATPVLERDR